MAGVAQRFDGQRGARPLIGLLASNRLVDGRRAQAVASRFIDPLVAIAQVSVLVVPAYEEAVDIIRLAAMFDGLLLPGCCSNIAPARYGAGDDPGCDDPGRDEVALRLGGAMIEKGRPVFGICRGMQELNVLFGGTLSDAPGRSGHYRDCAADDVAALFDHHHAVAIESGGMLAAAAGAGPQRVNSVHRQGVDRLGKGLSIEARADDHLIEAISARPCGAPLLGVQWHPEWNTDERPFDQSFFALLGRAARGDPLDA